MDPTKEVVFKSFPRTTSIADQIQITSTRFINNFYAGIKAEDLATIHHTLRPEIPIRDDDHLKTIISKPELLKIKKLSWVWSQDAHWATEFKDRVKSGQLSSLTKAKNEALDLYKTYCEDYDGSRATRAAGIYRKRSRTDEETNMEYRRKLAVQHILSPQKMIAFKDEVQTILSMEPEALEVQYLAKQRDIAKVVGDASVFDVTVPSMQADLVTLLASHLG